MVYKKEDYKRHICNCCKKKLYQKDMINYTKKGKYGHQTRYKQDVWLCLKCEGVGRRPVIY